MELTRTEPEARNITSTPKVAPTKASGVVSDVARSQPLLTLSGLGLAYGSLRSVLSKVKRVASLTSFYKLPKLPRFIPKYMKSNYVKYPAMFFILLTAVRKMRTLAINH